MQHRAFSQESCGLAIYRVAILALGVLLLWLTFRIDLLIFAGVLVATCLSHATAGLHRWTRLPRLIALALIVLLIVLVVGAIGWFFTSRLVQQIGELSQQLSNAIDALLASIKEFPFGHQLLEHVEPKTLEGSDIFKPAFAAASNVGEIIISVAVIVFVGLYGAAEPDVYFRGLLRLVPVPKRARATEILSESGDELWYWMLGRLSAMVALGVLTGLGLWALGMPVPLALGALAGMLTFIPYIGAFVSAIPALLLSLSGGMALALYVVGLYVALHVIEGYVLIPLVQRRAAKLPPALILVGQLIFGLLGGFLGLLLATPSLAALVVLVRAIYVEDVLGDRA